MNDNFILVMVDECGDEIEVERFHMQLGLDEDELEIWKAMKLEKAYKQFPEARYFYFEDRRHWAAMIHSMIDWN